MSSTLKVLFSFITCRDLLANINIRYLIIPTYERWSRNAEEICRQDGAARTVDRTHNSSMFLLKTQWDTLHVPTVLCLYLGIVQNIIGTWRSLCFNQLSFHAWFPWCRHLYLLSTQKKIAVGTYHCACSWHCEWLISKEVQKCKATPTSIVFN